MNLLISYFTLTTGALAIVIMTFYLIINYIVSAIFLYKAAKNIKDDQAFFAFIPIVNIYTLIRTAMATTRNKKFWAYLVLLATGFSLATAIYAHISANTILLLISEGFGVIAFSTIYMSLYHPYFKDKAPLFAVLTAIIPFASLVIKLNALLTHKLNIRVYLEEYTN